MFFSYRPFYYYCKNVAIFACVVLPLCLLSSLVNTIIEAANS